MAEKEDDGLDFLDEVQAPVVIRTPVVVRKKATVSASPENEKAELLHQLSEVPFDLDLI